MVARMNDRVLVLEKELTSKDTMMDPAVFTGGNQLHCAMLPGTSLWSFRYKHGVIPPALRNKFATFNQAKDHAEAYFKSKKIKIVDVKD